MKKSCITYLPITYQYEKNAMILNPLPESLWGNENYKKLFEDMILSNWNMVGSQPLLQEVKTISYEAKPRKGLLSLLSIFKKTENLKGQQIIAGYYFFWTKEE